MTTVGFIGVGTMGTPMSRHLVGKGFDVTLFDIAAGRAAKLAAELGCKAAQRLGDLGACEFIVTMLPDGKVVAETLTRMDDRALIRACKPGTIFIDMSSSEPMLTRETGAVLAKRGLTLVDAPVSGAKARAETGTLAIMIGASDPALIDKVTPVLSAMGNQLFVLGGLGNGHAMKAINNFIAGSAMVAVAEGMAIGEAFGLNAKVIVDVLNASTGRSFVTEIVAKDHVITGKFASGFALGLLAKDVRIAADLGEGIGLDAPLSRLARDRLAAARDALGAARDSSETFLAVKDLARQPKRKA